VNPASTSFVLGYHGCDREVAEQVLCGRSTLQPSSNVYDWLGTGIYFWEYNARRAFDFAVEAMRRPHNARQTIREPAVVGAVIDLGMCLNLLDSLHLEEVRRANRLLVRLLRQAGVPVPRNRGGRERLRRERDCAVINSLHQSRQESQLPQFDSVRAFFVEGRPLYRGAGFRDRNHVQVCVRNIACIKGYFRALDDGGLPVDFLRLTRGA
jgi:hypothetical protein